MVKKLLFIFLLVFVISPVFSSNNKYLNTAPTANEQTNVQAFEQVKVSITLTGTDPEDDLLTYVLHKVPANGNVSDPNDNNKTLFPGTIIKSNVIDYTSSSDSANTDSFEFMVFDGKLLSEPAKVSLSILLENDPPNAINQTVELTENTPTLITLSGTDPDGTVPSAFKIVTIPVTGTLTDPANNDQQINAGNYISSNKVTYTGQDTSSSDSFLFLVNDGNVESSVGTLSIIKIITDAPDALDQSVNVTEQVEKSIILTGFDKEGDDLNFIINSLPNVGILKNAGNTISENDLPKSIVGSEVVYVSLSDSATADSFTFRSNDGISSSFSGKVSIIITGVNDKPISSDISNVTAFEQIQKKITLQGSDPDGDQITYSIVDNPSNGTVTVDNNIANYTSTSNTASQDSFTYKTNDNSLDSEKATVLINIIQINDTPLANSQSVTVEEDKSIEITLTGLDNDNDDITFSIIGSTINGEGTLNINKVTYKPKLGYFGSDSFIFITNDGKENSDPASVTISITSNDHDDDGVLNEDDLCPNTPAGSKVNAQGCRFFELPTDNFILKVTSATCIGTLDGSFVISVLNSAYDYTISITGQSDVKIAGENKTASVTGLAKGAYTVCFKVDGQSAYEQCFEVSIEEPKALTAFVDVDEEERTSSIELGGSTLYNVEVNGKMHRVEGSSFTTSLPTGLSIIKVSTDLDCQGMIEREVFISEDVLYYPNPTKGEVDVYIHGKDNGVKMSVFTTKGDLLLTREQSILDTRKMDLNLTGLPSGTYLITLEGSTVRKTFKIIKR